MSLVGTFAVMYLLGYSLDNLSLMALTLAVGFVVDDAIVVLENIVRHIERGEPVLEAALNGSREISFTVISMTLSLVAVFIPVLFLGGLIGRLFQEFAVTIAVAILVSGFVSLTLTPMLCSRWLRPHGDGRRARPVLPGHRAAPGTASLAWYERSLAWVMDRRGLAMAVQRWRILIGTVVLGRIVPKGFIPSEDTGQLNGTTETAGGHQLRRHGAAPARGGGDRAGGSQRRRLHVVGGRRAAAAPRSIRAASSSTSRTAGQRPLDADAVAPARSPGSWPPCPGLRVFITNPPVINIGGPLVQEPVPVHPAELRHRRAVRRRGHAGAAAARGARAHRRHQRPADQESRGPGQHQPRPRRRRSAST